MAGSNTKLSVVVFHFLNTILQSCSGVVFFHRPFQNDRSAVRSFPMHGRLFGVSWGSAGEVGMPVERFRLYLLYCAE